MQIKSVLKQLGLNDRHASIYLACLENGSSSIQQISEKSGFARSTCEAVLKALQEKGFVTSYKKKNTKHFSPEDPKKLLSIAEDKVKLLQESLPQFSARYFKGGILPTVRLYQGEEGVKSVLQEILNEAREIKSFGSINDVIEAIPDYFKRFTTERLKRSIPIKIILKDSVLARERQKQDSSSLREIRIIPNNKDFSSITFIWNEKVAMFSLKNENIVFVIESDEMAKVQRTMFRMIWENCG